MQHYFQISKSLQGLQLIERSSRRNKNPFFQGHFGCFCPFFQDWCRADGIDGRSALINSTLSNTMKYVLAFFPTNIQWFAALFPTNFGCSNAFSSMSTSICYVFTGDEKVAKWRIMSSMIDLSDWSIFALYHYYTDSPHLFKVSRRRFQSLKMILWISHKANSDDIFQTELS